MIVWLREAPHEWTAQQFNTDRSRIAAYLDAPGADGEASAYVRVPHKPNRLVLFSSNLFHATDSLRFGQGYTKRRINYTLLFGMRGGRMRDQWGKCGASAT